MFVAKIRISHIAGIDDLAEHLHMFLGALRMNGQICGREFPIVQTATWLEAFVLVPEINALDVAHDNEYTQKHRQKIITLSKQQYNVNVLGSDPLSLDVCMCDSSMYILYTNYLSLESPLRCGDCFSPVPLYRIPPTINGEYHDIITWQSDYQSCDHLQMNCSVAVRHAIHELSQIDSDLSMNGLEVCRNVYKSTNKPTYYYLMRVKDVDDIDYQDTRHTCPSCDKDWRIDFEWHDMFAYKCNHCLLLSN